MDGVSWPCFLEDCISSFWSPKDRFAEFWDQSVDNSVDCITSLNFSDFQSLTSDLSLLLKTFYDSIHPTTPRLVVIAWQPNILTPVVIQGTLRSGAAFIPISLQSLNKQLMKYQALLSAVILLGDISSKTHSFLSSHHLFPCETVLSTILTKKSVLLQRGDFYLYLSKFVPICPLNVYYFCHRASPNQRLAYIIGTTGSSGEPKTVLIAHSCISANVIDLRQRFPLKKESSQLSGVLLSSPLTFDASIVQIYLAMFTRRRLIMPSSRILFGVDGNLLGQVCALSHVNLLQCTPSVFRKLSVKSLQVINESVNDVGIDVILGGEPCDYMPLMNQTVTSNFKFYVIYGVTEVSAWTSISCLESTQSSIFKAATPLGNPMMYSKMLLKDVNKVTGVGKLYISRNGGGYAIFEKKFQSQSFSTADLKHTLPKLVNESIWSTGDNAVFEPESFSKFWFVGRNDSVIKVYGKKVYLESLERIGRSVLADELLKHQLYVVHYLILTPNQDSNLLKVCVQIAGLDIGVSSVENDDEILNNSELCTSWKNLILLELSKHFSAVALPSEIIFTYKALKLNNHGKLVRITIANATCRHEHKQMKIKSFIRIAIGASPVLETESFMEQGGSSLSALWLTETLINEWPCLKTSKSSILTCLFTSPILLVVRSILHLLETFEFTHNLDDIESDFFLGNDQLNSQVSVEHNFTEMPNPINKCKLKMRTLWSSYLGKCVDASALVVEIPEEDLTIVCIGSHSGYFKAINLFTGDVIWSKFISRKGACSRIEASASLFIPPHQQHQTADNPIVLFGTLDGEIFALNCKSGEILWKFDTGGAVKASPTVVPNYSIILTASHGKEMHAFDLLATQQLLWSINLDDSAIVAKVIVIKTFDSAQNMIIWHAIVGSLAGNLHCVETMSGRRVWVTTKLGPIFSAVICFSIKSSNADKKDFITVTTADGQVHGLKAKNGQRCWSIQLDGGFFTSPVLLSSKDLLLLAGQSGCLYAIDPRNGVVTLTIDFKCYPVIHNSPTSFLTTPSVFILDNTNEELIFIGRTDGILFTCFISATNQPQVSILYQFAAETFSSPIPFHVKTIDGYQALWISIGCRDDHIYGLEFLISKE